MRISKVLLLMLLALAPVVASATGQAADIIYIDGQQWWLMGRAVTFLDSAHYDILVSHLPENRSQSTANWDGYIGYWSLDGDILILDSVVCEVYNDYEHKEYHEESLPKEVMQEVFGNYYHNGRIEATFVTWENIRVTQGQRLYYEHSGWERFYETELILKVEQGRVVNRTLYHNRVVVDGFCFDDLSFEGLDKFREEFAPVLRKYHELDTVGKVYFSMNHWTIDTLGNMTDVEVKAICRCHEDILPQLAMEFKQYILNIRPWKIWYINGEYTHIYRGWNIPFRRQDWD